MPLAVTAICVAESEIQAVDFEMFRALGHFLRKCIIYSALSFVQRHYFILPFSFVTSCRLAYINRSRLTAAHTRVGMAAGRDVLYWSDKIMTLYCLVWTKKCL